MKITEQEDIHFVAIGDWGSGDQHQEEVGEHFLTLFHNFSIFTGCCNNGRILPLEQMRLCRLHRGQFLRWRSRFSHWQEVRQQMENYVLPYKHSRTAMVGPCSLQDKIIVGLRYLTLGNHDYHYDREWFQVDHSALEPRWRLPCLTHSFNVTNSVRSIKY